MNNIAVKEGPLHPARSKVLRGWFFIALILAAAVILLLRFKFFPEAKDAADWKNTVGAVLDNLLAAVATSLAIGLAYVFLLPSPEAESLEVIQPRSIAEVIEAAARNCTRWHVRARTASYFTREILPLLRDNALRSGGSIRIKVQILDPENGEALEAYAVYRSNKPGASAAWSAARVRTEIYSTLLAAAVYRNEAPRLQIDVGLSPDFWVLSLDLSDDTALIAGQNKDEPALCIRKSSQLFSGWSEDFDAGFSMCRIIRPSVPGLNIRDLSRPSAATLGSIRSFLDSMGFTNIQDAELKEIAKFMSREHNYA
jgi:hypothetical protein